MYTSRDPFRGELHAVTLLRENKKKGEKRTKYSGASRGSAVYVDGEGQDGAGKTYLCHYARHEESHQKHLTSRVAVATARGAALGGYGTIHLAGRCCEKTTQH